MKPTDSCHACRRHLKPDDLLCRHCGEFTAAEKRRFVSTVSLIVLACVLVLVFAFQAAQDRRPWSVPSGIDAKERISLR